MSEPYRAPPKLFGDPFVSVAGACGYADGVGHLGDHLTHVLRRVEARRKEAAKKWLWDVRERAVLVRDGGGRRLRFPAGWTEEDREAVEMWRDVIVGLLRDDPDVGRWFARQEATPAVAEAGSTPAAGLVGG